jgi:putative hemolysin
MTQTQWLIVQIILCAGIGGLFSLMHLSLRSYSRPKLQEAFEFRGKADRLDAFAAREEDFLLTTLLFRLFADVGILLALAQLAQLHQWGTLVVFIIGWLLLAAFRLAIPHSWSKYTAELLLARSGWFLSFCAWLAWPALRILHWHDALVRRLAGVERSTPQQQQDQKQEEILSLVEEGQREGAVDAEQAEMIENVLEMGETTVEEVMTPRTDIVAVEIREPLAKILQTIADSGYSRLPVCEGNIDNIVGLLYAKDLLGEIGKSGEPFNLRDRIRPAYFVPETKPLRTLLSEFQNQKLHIAVVLDEYGGTAGVVTIEDILEELVGEISDEFEDAPAASAKRIDETTMEIDARMYIDDVNEECGVQIPEGEDYDTISGFVLSHLGRIPRTGEIFETHGARFTVVAAEPRRIKRLRIQRLASSPAAES